MPHCTVLNTHRTHFFRLAIMALVYANELPHDEIARTTFCDRTDKLVDTLNSSSPKTAVQKCWHALQKGDAEPVQFLNDQIPWIQSWKFDDRQLSQTIVGWQITIRAILEPWESVATSCGFLYLPTWQLQQDPLENKFGVVRQKHGCNTRPTVTQFILERKHICIQQLYKLSKNCGKFEDDRSQSLQALWLLPWKMHLFLTV